MTKLPVRVGIIGTGWGVLSHAPAVQHVDGYELAALCGRSVPRLERAATRLGVQDMTTDWHSFIKRSDLDLIVVTTPVTMHCEMVLEALKAGKHVMCEKPLAATALEAEEMVVAADSAGTVTATSFQLRWMQDRLAIWDTVRNGVMGDPYFARLCQRAAYWHPCTPSRNAWMYRVEDGGGFLNALVSHDIDFVATLFGPPTEVMAVLKTTIPQRTLEDGSTIDVTADDTVVVLLRMASGALVELSASVVALHTRGSRFEAFGSDGTILSEEADMADQRLWMALNDGVGLVPLAPSTRLPSGRAVDFGGSAFHAMALMYEDWLPAFSGSETDAPSFSDGWLVQRVIDAARRSSPSGGWVSVD